MLVDIGFGQIIDVEPESKCPCHGPKCVLTAGDQRHGKTTGYGNSRCRCAPCCQAWSDYSRAARHERRSVGLAAGDPRHGTDNGYTNYNCRCELCTQARAAYRKASYPKVA